MIKLICLLVALTFSLHATANIRQAPSPCIQNDTDLCAFANDIADTLNQQLPLKLNSIMTMEAALASRNEVVIILRLDQEQGNEFREALLTLEDKGEEVKQIILAKIMKGGCDDESSAMFVNSGGHITYRFLFADNTQFANVMISDCHPE